MTKYIHVFMLSGNSLCSVNNPPDGDHSDSCTELGCYDKSMNNHDSNSCGQMESLSTSQRASFSINRGLV